jgi:hypothetical protein
MDCRLKITWAMILLKNGTKETKSYLDLASIEIA